MKIQPTPIASAVALALFGMTAVAQAQQAPAPAGAASAPKADEVQTITVTGIRASLQQSLSQKRNADAAVEVITAEDVGKMPDKNVADSLQRIPGVNVATAGGTEGGFGENDRVSLRGTPSSLTLTTLNGHTVSSGDWYSLNMLGGARSVSYSLLPSELIGRVTVHKSPQADLIEGGAVGTVDIETRRPLDFKQSFTGLASVQAVNSSLSGKTDPQLSALVSWKNEANTAGVLFQAFYEKRHLRRDGQEFLWWDTTDNLWNKNGDVLAAHPDLHGKYISLLTGSALFQQERERQGGLVDVQFKPSNEWTVDLSAFYSKLNAVNFNANYMYAPVNALTNGISPSSYTITGNTVTSITFPSTCPLADCSGVSSGVQDIAVRPGAYSDSSYFNVDVSFKPNGQLSLEGKAGHTNGTGTTKDIGFEVWSPYVGGSYTTHALGETADVSVPGSDQFSIGGVSSGIGGWASYVTAKDQEDYFQLDGTYRLDMESIPRVKFGVRYANHKRDLTDIPGSLSAAGGLASNAPLGAVTNFPGDFGSTLPGGLLKGAWTIPGADITDWANANMSFGGHTYQSEFSIKEPVTSAYVMADIATDMVQGNVGVRLVNTQEEVTNNVLNASGGYDPLTIKNTYHDVLPSLNLRTDLAKNLIGRLGLSRSMARPDFGQLGGLSLLDIQQTGTGGNANLKPIRSNNVNATLEWYFQPKSLLAADVYFMDLQSYVTYGSFKQTFYNQSQKQFTEYNMSAPVNTTARVHGFELAYEQAIGAGFGVMANYTYADGKETGNVPNSSCSTNGNCDMVGTSKNSYNLGAYYEDERFSARVAYNYRSAFLNGLDRKSAIYQDAVGTISASLNYNLTKSISLSLEGKDLNDPLLKSYATSPDQPRAFYKNGRQIYFGLRAKI